MKLKVLKDFVDGEDRKTIYKEGEIIEVSNARAKAIMNNVYKVAEIVEEVKEEKKDKNKDK